MASGANSVRDIRMPSVLLGRRDWWREYDIPPLFDDGRLVYDVHAVIPIGKFQLVFLGLNADEVEEQLVFDDDDSDVIIPEGLQNPYLLNWKTAKLFDVRTREVTDLPLMLEPHLDGAATVSLDGRKIYFFGGEITDTGEQLLAGNEMLDLDHLDQGWQRLPEGSIRRRHAAAVAAGTNKILLVGGEDAKSHSLRSTEIFDTGTNQWTWMGVMNAARSYPAVGYLLGSDKVIVAGGYGFPQPQATVEMLEMKTMTWKRLADMPRARNFPLFATIGPHQFAVVGRNTSWSDTEGTPEATLLYDGISDTWSVFPHLHFEGQDYSCAVMLGSKLLVIGSADGNENISAEALDVDPVVDVLYEVIHDQHKNGDLDRLHGFLVNDGRKTKAQK